jgi:hypothetical protein
MPNNETETTEQPTPVHGWAILRDNHVQPDSVSERRSVAIEWAENMTGESWHAAKRDYDMRVAKVTISVEGPDDVA